MFLQNTPHLRLAYVNVPARIPQGIFVGRGAAQLKGPVGIVFVCALFIEQP